MEARTDHTAGGNRTEDGQLHGGRGHITITVLQLQRGRSCKADFSHVGCLPPAWSDPRSIDKPVSYLMTRRPCPLWHAAVNAEAVWRD